MMEQDKRRAEEDLEFKMMIPLAQSDTPPGKAAYHRRRISIFQSVMPTRLIFDDTVKWDDQTAQRGRRFRRLSPQQISTVDQSDSCGGREERWSPLPTTINRLAADYRNAADWACTLSASGCARAVTTSDRGRHTEMQKGGATRSATGKQPTAEHMRYGTRLTPGGDITSGIREALGRRRRRFKRADISKEQQQECTFKITVLCERNLRGQPKTIEWGRPVTDYPLEVLPWRIERARTR